MFMKGWQLAVKQNESSVKEEINSLYLNITDMFKISSSITVMELS